MLTLLFACTSGPAADSGLDDDSGDSGDPCTPVTWFADADGDGFGAASQALEDCDQPSGHVADDTDCDDTSAEVHPDADELCATVDVDDDCDGELNEPDAIDARTWYADADGDGFGGPDGSLSCAPVDGAYEESTDCDDSDDSVFPGAAEICDGLQNDCSTTWTSDAGLAHFVDNDGAWTDVASDLTGDITWTEPGTLHICDGTWTVQLTLDADISIQGHGDVVLSGEETGPVVTIASDELVVELSDLTLADGLATEVPPTYRFGRPAGGGLQCFVDAEVTLDSVGFRNNTSETSGAGIALDGCSATWIDGSVDSTSDVTDESQVGIWHGSFTMFGGEFADFSSYDGFLMAFADSTVSIEDVWFHDFVVEEWLFFVAEEDDVCPTIAVTGSTFEDGDTGHYGVINTYDDGCTASMHDSTMSRLQGDVIVAAIEGGTFSLTDSTVEDCVVDGDGGVLDDGAESIVVEGCTFTGNSGDYALVYVYEDLVIRDTVFSDNAIEGYAAVAAFGETEIDSCTFEDNSGEDGGAIYNRGAMTITDSVFARNSTSSSGGAIRMDGGREGDELTIASSDFVDNDPDDVRHGESDTNWVLGEDAALYCDAETCSAD